MGKTIMITGATSGIGKTTALELISQGHNLILACRNKEKMDRLINSIKKQGLNSAQKIDGVILDLSSLESIRRCTLILKGKYDLLDVLINNAGVFNLHYRESKDSYEETFAVNHLGHFLLTKLLLPLLEKSKKGRIVNVGSMAHKFGKLDLNDLFFTKRKYNSFAAYSASRLATVFFTQELSTRLKDKGVSANSLHPGQVDTNIWNFENPSFGDKISMKLQRITSISPEKGCETSVFLAVSELVEGISGAYFVKKKPRQASRQCKNLELQKKLWEKCELLIQ